MDTTNLASANELRLINVMALIFIPTSILTIVYYAIGAMTPPIPSLLLFFLCAVIVLFPIELAIVLMACKKEYGRYSLKCVFANDTKMSWWKIILYGGLLFALAGLMSALVAPLENRLFASLSSTFSQSLPAYFDWTNLERLKEFPKNMLLITCVSYFVLNVFVGPIVEELFFRGYLTSKIRRYGSVAPFIMTVLFSLYHFWLPFNNLFRISAFFPAAFPAWKKKNICIAIVFHCLCNLFSTLGFILSIYPS